MSFFSLQNLRNRSKRVFQSRRCRPDIFSSTNTTKENSSLPDFSPDWEEREDFASNSSPVRLRRQPVLNRSLQYTSPDRSRRHGMIHRDLFFSPEDLSEDNDEPVPLRQFPGRRHRLHRRPLEYMDDEGPDCFRDIEAHMNEMREEMDISINHFYIPPVCHRIELDIPSIPRCRHRMFLCDRMTPEERRIKDECNAGMMKAASENDLALLTQFVHRGAGIFHSDDAGWTALHIAASNGFTEIANFLMSVGLYRDCKTYKGETPLMLAARSNHLSTVKCLFRNEAKVDITDKQGRTPLMYAAESADKELLQVFTEKDAKINTTDKDGNTALIWGTMHKNDAAVKFFVNKFYRIDLEKKTKEKNWTALHWAVSTASETNIRELVNAGAALNACHFNKGETPVKLAHRLGNQEILRLMHSLEAVSHRRIAYCSDGEEFKYYCFLLGPPLKGDPPKSPLPEHSAESLSLYQTIQDELRKQEEIELENQRREVAASQPPSSKNSVPQSAETGSADVEKKAASNDRKGTKAQGDEKSKISTRRKQIQNRRRLIRRKVDPVMAMCADDIRNAADNSAIKDEVYPPPLKIEIHVLTLIFLCLQTENVKVQNMSCVQMIGMDAVPPVKKSTRRG